MFTVLLLEEKTKNRFLTRVKEKLKPTPPTLQRCEVKGGAPFFILKLNYEKGEIPWDKVVHHAGRSAKSLVMPDEITPPEDSGIKKYTPEYLPFILLFNTAIKQISEDVIEPRLRRITVIDERAILAKHIEKAVDIAGEITVITKNKERYDAVSQAILNKTGAVIRTVDEVEPFTNYIIAENIENSDTQAKVYCLNHSNVTAREIYVQENIVIPEQYEELRPAEIDAITFASALYEMCGVRELESLSS